MVHILVTQIYSEHKEEMKELKKGSSQKKGGGGGDAVLKEPKPKKN